jgi:hypothetical protein
MRSSLFWDVTQCTWYFHLLTFQDNLLVPSSSIKQSQELHCLTLEDKMKSKDLIYTAAEAWNHAHPRIFKTSSDIFLWSPGIFQTYITVIWNWHLCECVYKNSFRLQNCRVTLVFSHPPTTETLVWSQASPCEIYVGKVALWQFFIQACWFSTVSINAPMLQNHTSFTLPQHYILLAPDSIVK